MNILYIGSGFVGACSAAISADSGHSTLVFDIDENKIKKLGSGDKAQIDSVIFEEGLADLLTRHKDRISFTTDYSQVKSFLDKADAIFMCLPTPEIGETGESNLEYYNKAATQLAPALKERNAGGQDKYVVLVNKSTVPINMVDQTAKIMDEAGVKNYGVVSNPEFLVEGKAIEGSIRPDRVVVGAWQEKDFEVMRSVYDRFYNSATVKYLEVNPKEAAAGKLLANFYLFNKLAVCFDVIGRTSEAFEGVRFEELRKIITGDERIGNWGFYDSLYAGGSCFIKDARSLSHQLKDAGKVTNIVDETYQANKRQLTNFLERAKSEAGLDWSGKTVALVGLAFKRDTNDTRNSPSLEIVKILKEAGVGKIQVYDPVAQDSFKYDFPESDKLVYSKSEAEVIKNVDVIILSTDWPQFRSLADTIIKDVDSKTLIMDGRRILQHKYSELKESGFSIIAVGSPFIKGNNL